MSTILAADLGEAGCFLVTRNAGSGPEVCSIWPWIGWTLRAEHRQSQIGMMLRVLCQQWGVDVVAVEKALHLKRNPRIGSSQRWRTKYLRGVMSLGASARARDMRWLEVPPQGPTEAYYSWVRLRETCAQETWYDAAWDKVAEGEHIWDAASICRVAEADLRLEKIIVREVR